MTVWYKEGVYGELRYEAAKGLRLVKILYASKGKDVFVTSIRESTHGIRTLHHLGDAFDIRKNGVSIRDIRRVLGKDFDVVNEWSHFHIEFQPKG